MKRCRFTGLALLGVLVSCVSWGCGGVQSNSAPQDPPTNMRASGVATPSLKVGDLLPPLQAEGWVNGPPSPLNAPGVRLLVVDVWGYWCPYCDKSAPGLLRVYKKFSGQGVAFVSLTNTEQETVERYVQKSALPWPSGYGVSPQLIVELGASSGMQGPAAYEVAPTLYLVGPDSRIRWVDGRGRARHQNPQEWENAVEAAVAEALGAPPSKP